ncbi:hypothetical protein WN943_029623 [Citrus x changshan-huyou]
MMFEDFQDQFVEAVELSMKKWVQDGENFLYIVIMDDNSEKQYVKGKITTHYLVVPARHRVTGEASLGNTAPISVAQDVRIDLIVRARANIVVDSSDGLIVLRM